MLDAIEATNSMFFDLPALLAYLAFALVVALLLWNDGRAGSLLTIFFCSLAGGYLGAFLYFLVV
jgi:hypothetical protein